MFYKNLYTAAPCNTSKYKQFFEDPNLPKLDETEKNELQLPLTNEECLHILEQCAKGKCPGTDGLSVEFYLHSWPMLGEELVQSLNYGFEQQHLNITQKQGIIKVIPKKRKDKSYLENWRPLTLLKSDFLSVENRTTVTKNRFFFYFAKTYLWVNLFMEKQFKVPTIYFTAKI